MPFAFHCDSNCESLQETDRDWRRVSMWFSSIYLSLCFSLLSFFINSPRHILFMIAYQYEIPIDNTCFSFFFFFVVFSHWNWTMIDKMTLYCSNSEQIGIWKLNRGIKMHSGQDAFNSNIYLFVYYYYTYYEGKWADSTIRKRNIEK